MMDNDKQTGTEPLAGMHELPHAIEPDKDLWPGISAALPPQEQAQTGPGIAPAGRWRLGAVAASIVVAFIAGLLFGRQAPLPVQSFPTLSQAGAAAPSLAAALTAVELEYAAAYKGFMPINSEPVLLDVATTEDLRTSWAAMQEAEVALKAALQEHPDNPFLGHKLLSLRAQQLEFMRQLHMLDQNSWRNT